MKRILTRALGLALSLLLPVAAHAHGKVELGPNQGRLLEFSADDSLHGELTLKDGVFRVGLLDKDLKPLPLEGRKLEVIGGERAKPETLKVEAVDGSFTFPAPKTDGGYLILRFTPAPGAKVLTERFKYDTAVCSGCKRAEWMCTCAH